MKLLIFNRTVFLLILAFALPTMLFAGDRGIGDQAMNQVVLENDFAAFQDSIPSKRVGRGQDKDSKGKKDKNPEDTRIPLKGKNQKPSIKEVPRSIPKLKPQAVRDRIPIRKLPVKIPKKGIRINRF